MKIKDIVKDLKTSPHIAIIEPYQFYFSSPVFLSKFVELYENELISFNERTSNIYKDKFNLEMDMLALVRLYDKIEKRGFYIKIGEEEVTCLNSLTFVLQPRIRSLSGS